MKGMISRILAIVGVVVLVAACSGPPMSSTASRSIGSISTTSSPASPLAFPPSPKITPAATTSEEKATPSPMATLPPTTAARTEHPSDSRFTGTIVRSGTLNDSDPVDENGKVTMRTTDSYYYSGYMHGTIVQKSVTEVVHESREFTSVAEGTFTGTVDGKRGTLRVTAVAKGRMSSSTVGAFTALYNVLGGTDELSNLRGTIAADFSFNFVFFSGTYSANFTLEG